MIRCPQEIVTDQGRVFCGKLMDSLEELTEFSTRSPAPIVLRWMGSMTIQPNAEISAAQAHQQPPRWLGWPAQQHFAYIQSSRFLLMYGLEAHLLIGCQLMLLLTSWTSKPNFRICWSCKRSYMISNILWRKHRPIRSGSMMHKTTPIHRSKLVTRFLCRCHHCHQNHHPQYTLLLAMVAVSSKWCFMSHIKIARISDQTVVNVRPHYTNV